MSFPKLAVSARKIHRFLVIFIVILGLTMMITGTTMKYPNLMPIDPFLARRTHNIVSTFFSITLLGMMLTGSYSFLFPWLIKTFRNKPTPNQPQE